jgi:hypothetical protein
MVVMNSTNFWHITPCSPLKIYRRFGGTYHLRLQCQENKLSEKLAWKLVSSRLTTCFHARILCGLLTLKMEAICSSEMMVDFQRTTCRYIAEDSTLQAGIQFFVKISVYKFNENLSGGSRVVSMLTNGRTDWSTKIQLVISSFPRFDTGTETHGWYGREILSFSIDHHRNDTQRRYATILDTKQGGNKNNPFTKSAFQGREDSFVAFRVETPCCSLVGGYQGFGVTYKFHRLCWSKLIGKVACFTYSTHIQPAIFSSFVHFNIEDGSKMFLRNVNIRLPDYMS